MLIETIESSTDECFFCQCQCQSSIGSLQPRKGPPKKSISMLYSMQVNIVWYVEKKRKHIQYLIGCTIEI